VQGFLSAAAEVYLDAMTNVSDPKELVGRTADELLLSSHRGSLPGDVGQPESIPESRARGRLVALGATLTAVSLILGIALMLFGVVDAVSGSLDAVDGAALVIGALLAGTHWGWVHIAEITANSIERREQGGAIDRQHQWLKAIEPYARHEVTTSVGDDGAITITTITHRPVPRGEHNFTFQSEVTHSEVHSSEEPSAAIVERAELLRRQAAADTQGERERYEAVAGAYESARMASTEREHEQAVHRAESEALSERINTHMREPPLAE
jgi:hypothetical protein